MRPQPLPRFTIAAGLSCAALLGCQSRPCDLAVALFAYTPDAHATAERLELAFEQDHPSIDLDVDLIDPYAIGLDKNKVFRGDTAAATLRAYDIVEIDACRLDDLRQHLDRLPNALQNLGAPYAPPTASFMARVTTAEYLVPHWACGNVVVTWSSSALAEVDTFDEICAHMAGERGSAVLADFAGSTTLGEYYADWLIDHHGAQAALEKLRALGARTAANPVTAADIERAAIDDFRAMALELHPDFVQQLDRYHDATHVYPHRFYDPAEQRSILIGYSERLYFVASRRTVDPKHVPKENEPLPMILAQEVDVRPLAFGERNQGTPVWLDGFVLPHGKYQHKPQAIAKFLTFVNSPKAYEVFRLPAGYGPAAHLLPCPASEYAEEVIAQSCPALGKYRDALLEAVPLDESAVWRGIRAAGSVIEGEVLAAAAARPSTAGN